MEYYNNVLEDGRMSGLGHCAYLRGYDKLIANSSLLRPFTDELLRRLILTERK